MDEERRKLALIEEVGTFGFVFERLASEPGEGGGEKAAVVAMNFEGA
jgi:hypothetical protein